MRELARVPQLFRRRTTASGFWPGDPARCRNATEFFLQEEGEEKRMICGKKTDARPARTLELRNEIYVLLKSASNDEAASPRIVRFSNDFMTSKIRFYHSFRHLITRIYVFINSSSRFEKFDPPPK